MSVDFTGVKNVTIPEGVVKKITKDDGAVLWEKPASGFTVWFVDYGSLSGNKYTISHESTTLSHGKYQFPENTVFDITAIGGAFGATIHSEFEQEYVEMAYTDTMNKQINYSYTLNRDTVFLGYSDAGLITVKLLDEALYNLNYDYYGKLPT